MTLPRRTVQSPRPLTRRSAVLGLAATAALTASGCMESSETASTRLVTPSPTSRPTAVPTSRPTAVPTATPVPEPGLLGYFGNLIDDLLPAVVPLSMALPWGLPARAGLALVLAVGGSYLADEIAELPSDAETGMRIHANDATMATEFPDAPIPVFTVEHNHFSVFNCRVRGGASGCGVIQSVSADGVKSDQFLEADALVAVAGAAAFARADSKWSAFDTANDLWPVSTLNNAAGRLDDTSTVDYNAVNGPVSVCRVDGGTNVESNGGITFVPHAI